MQNDRNYLTYENFESNPLSTLKTTKFDCLDLSVTVYPLVYHCLSIRKPRPMSYDCILHINANVKEDKSSNQNSAIISGPHSSGVRN